MNTTQPDISKHLNVEPWSISESAFNMAQNPLHETLFTLGNGQIGVRGAHEEGDIWPGTLQNDVFINGFFESEPIVYPEAAYGFAKNNQFIVRVPNTTGITFSIGDEQFHPSLGQISHYQRRVDFKTGVLSRSFIWSAPSGKSVLIENQRLVSFSHSAVIAQRYSVTPLNFEGVIEFESSISNLPRAHLAGDDPRVGASLSGQLSFVSHHTIERGAAFVHRTQHSDLSVASTITHDLTPSQSTHDEQVSRHVFSTELKRNQPYVLVKYAAYSTNQNSPSVPTDNLLSHAQAALSEAAQIGFDTLVTLQTEYLSTFWRNADIEIGGDEALQQGMRFSAFHLLQSAGRDGKTNIAAKGLTGAGYDGHYFWDTEIYMLPFFTHTHPSTARKLLEYRANTLDTARARAREMAHKQGALYPWRTITGPECSSYFPAGTAQYHINADIAYATALYTRVTGDQSFLLESGAEMVFETARIWPDFGAFDKNGAFGIYSVTGPDEYTAIVNNNVFTNVMARQHLRFALETANWLAIEHPAFFSALQTKINLSSDELSLWQRIVDNMTVLYDESLGIHPQDEAFLSKPVWDFAHTPAENYPLLLHYHPLVIYRHQVCKQADVLLALLLLSSEFSAADKKRDFDYYEAITTHDSSLSSCIFSIMASEVGYADKAYDYFMQTARLDLDNLHHNTQHGVHEAALAGTWMSVVYGFAGMRSDAQVTHFAPKLPKNWTHYQFQVQIQGCLLQVRVNHEAVVYQLLEGASLKIMHQNSELNIGQAPVSAALSD